MLLSIPASFFILLRNCTNDPARIAYRYGIIRNVLYHNTSSSDYNITANRHSRHNLNTCSNPDIIPYGNWISIF